jgi:glycosyltransferase involved in cell wall biosynthesis
MTAQSQVIAIFLPALSGGGAERVMLRLARGLVARGIPVQILLARAEGPLLAEVPAGADVVDLGAGTPWTKLGALVRYLREQHPRVLLSALDNINVGAWAAMLAGVQTRVVVSVHNTLSESMNERSGPVDKLRRALHLASYRLGNDYVAVSEGVARDLETGSGVSRSRIHVIPNPVVADDLESSSTDAPEHLWFGQSIPIVLGVGRLTAQTDFSTLLHAFALVRKRRPARLIILGEGEQREPLEALAVKLGIGAAVDLPGFVANPYAFMAGASVFVLSSLWEGLPTVLIEAMAVGTPVVATDCPHGPREILQDGAFGELVPVSDPTLMADAICRALDATTRPDLRAAVEPYTAARAEQAYLALLQPGSRHAEAVGS